MQDKAASRSTMISADTDGFLGHPPGSYKDNRYGKAGTGWKGPGLGDEGGGGAGREQDGARTNGRAANRPEENITYNRQEFRPQGPLGSTVLSPLPRSFLLPLRLETLNRVFPHQ